jgi:predicted transposase
MQLTIEAAWYPAEKQQQIIKDHMNRFQIVKRYAFKRLLEGYTRQPIVGQIRQQEILSNARYIRSAIEDAKATIKAQHELVNLYCKENVWKVKQTSQRLRKYQQALNQELNPLTKKQYQKLKSLHTQSQKAQSAQLNWQTNQKNKTIPPIVFGGKKTLQLYQKGKISKKEWTKRRNNGIYCIGEKNQQGNANFRLNYTPHNDNFTFSMLLDPVDRGRRNERLNALLYVPTKYKPLFRRLAKGDEKYTVRVLLSTEGTFYRVLVTTDQTAEVIPNNNGIAGIDLNPTGIAVTLVYPDGNYRCSRWFFCPELMYAREGKRNWLIGNLVGEVLKWITSYKLNFLSLEDLTFSKQFDLNKRFNRIKANFVHKKFVQTIQAQAIKQKMIIKLINPAYTSILGKFKYQRCYGLNNHQAAALVIARRGLGFNEKLYAHINGKRLVLVVPPMEGWSSKQIHRFSREVDEFTAHLSNLTSKVSVGYPRLFTRRQGSGGGIVPRDHTPTPGTGASVFSGVNHES